MSVHRGKADLATACAQVRKCEIGLDTTMHGVALRLYDESRGVDPMPAIEKLVFRTESGLCVIGRV